MIAAIRFGSGVRQTPEETAPFAELEDLYVQHSILINDLYSYDKEIYEARTINGSVVNAVHVIEKLMCVPPHLAKTISRTMSFDVEKKYYAESEKFMRDPALNDKQRTYVIALFDCLTGNLFHHATLGRYSRYAEYVFDCKT